LISPPWQKWLKSTTLLVKGMRHPNPNAPTPQIDTNINDEQFCHAIHHTRERMPSSPSSRHYGNYRTLLHDPDLLSYISSLANFCFHWGVLTLQWWEKVTQPLIPKDPGPPHITRLWRIVLGSRSQCMPCLVNLLGAA
jgi:hypothetical protein